MNFWLPSGQNRRRTEPMQRIIIYLVNGEKFTVACESCGFCNGDFGDFIARDCNGAVIAAVAKMQLAAWMIEYREDATGARIPLVRETPVRAGLGDISGCIVPSDDGSHRPVMTKPAIL